MTASTSQSQCCVCRLDSSHYIEHFACVDFTQFLFLPYSFNLTGLGLIVFSLGLMLCTFYYDVVTAVCQLLVNEYVMLCYVLQDMFGLGLSLTVLWSR